LSRDFNYSIGNIILFNKDCGDIATFYSFGLARKTTPERVKRLLGDVYKGKMQDVRFALLYGSRKEFSDIDVFMVGQDPEESHSPFLDVKMQSHRDLQKGIKNFDVKIIVPLIEGDFIFGNRDYFEQAKSQILFQEITGEAIKHNLKWSVRMKGLKEENLENKFLRNKFEKYSQTYLANALALKEGRRLFTKEDLISYSLNEKNTQFKGGAEKNAT